MWLWIWLTWPILNSKYQTERFAIVDTQLTTGVLGHPSHEEDQCQVAASTSCSIDLLAIVIAIIASILLEHRA